MKCVNKLKEGDDHQYPPLIRNIKSKTGLPLHIIILDPQIKLPPYCVISSANKWTGNKYYNNIFTSDENTNVYAMQYTVTYKYLPPKDGIDITKDLDTLNKFCNANKHFLFFHDFTGRDTWLLAHMYDQQKYNTDLIVYDITNRSEGKCYTDLLNPLFQLQLFFDTNDKYYKVFNTYNKTATSCKNQKNEIINKQFLDSINRRISIFKNGVYSAYRRFYVHQKEFPKISQDKLKDFIKMINLSEYTYLNVKYVDFLKYIKNYLTDHNEDNLMLLVSWLFEILKQELIEIIRMITDEHYDSLVNDLLDVIYDDPYRWTDKLDMFLEHTLKQCFF